MNGTILCVDIGTSSLKSALITSEGNVVAYNRERFQETENFQGEIWFQAFAASATKLLNCNISKKQILGICISGNGPTISASSGETLLWNQQVPKISPELFSENPNISKSLFLPRLVAFKNMYPKIWENATYVFSAAEYLIWRLTNKAVTILPEERFRSTYWEDESLKKLNLQSEKLPPFVFSGTQVGLLKKEIVQKINLTHEIPVFAGAPDFIVAMIGTNTLQPGNICDRAGTSEGINLCIDIMPEINKNNSLTKNMRFLPSVIPGLYNASLLIADSGKRFSMFRKKYANNIDYETFVSSLINFPERNPEGTELLNKIVLEVKDSTNKILALCKQLGYPTPKAITTTGGQGKNHTWLQYKSSAIGINIQVTNCPDAELIGDAVLGFMGLGLYNSIQEGASKMVKISKTFFPKRD